MRTLSYVAIMAVVVGFAMMAGPAPSYASCDQSALGQVVYGQSGLAVKTLQECLITAGYTIPAGVTGYYGTQTRTAVQQFYQKSLGMTWDGQSVGPQGRAKLVTLAQGPGTGGVVLEGYKRAGSATEIAQYVAEREKSQTYGAGKMVAMSDAEATAAPSVSPTPSRVSETNVQVAGVDEPDIVKTDGNNLYISKQGWYYDMFAAPTAMEDQRIEGVSSMPPVWQDPSKTLVLDAYPVEDLAVLSKSIEEKGEMLLVKDKHLLIILSQPSLVAYDVTDPKKPVKKWTLTLESGTSLTASRLTNGTLYLVTQTWINNDAPCPYVPITRGATEFIIPCRDIWIPARIEPVSNTFTVLAVDPVTGNAKQTLAFAAEGDTTTVSLFKDNLYLATKSYNAPYKVLIDITPKAYAKYLSGTSITKMRTIAGYEISPAGKLNEITVVAQAELAQKSVDEQLRIETEVQNTIQKELNLRKRELDRTRITRVPLANLAVAAVGEVPGMLLNQFSLDEYNGNVRVAVTVGNNGWGAGETANDVYVLGSDLKEKGRITDLGLGERVYSARFVGDTAYLVTFKQIDPFYVLDLSVPTAPKLAGELKIPGYSAYLEPLGNGLVLGVGREGNGVKLSVFDVSNPVKPVEKSKYIIKDSWTEVEGNHHAFLRDAEHKVFFIPGGNGGYVFSYASGKLSLKSTIAGWSVKRAVYIDNNMYVIGDEKISVLNESTWKVVKELKI
ncbi:MAG: beta-propeller domain-containing protein [Candidatus Pacebacteria bacterium]|nr:beta-propeller domain-containing protein [Candidatus Paceibacterota bacterium]